MDTGYIVVHELHHACRLGNDDSQLYGLSELFCLLHEFDEFLRLKDSLSLEILGACCYLSLHLCKLRVHRIAAGRYNGSLRELGRLAYQLVSAQILAFFQLRHCMKQRNGIQIEYRLCLGMITQLGVVACQAENVVNAEHGCA